MINMPTDAPIDYKALTRRVHEVHNKLREDPQSLISQLEEMLEYFDGTLYKYQNYTIYTNEGASAIEECIEYLKKAKPRGKLTFDENLTKACFDHLNDIGPKSMTGHYGSNGSGLSDRIRKYVNYNTAGENLAFGIETAEEIIRALMVDDGIPSRGHRTNMFNSDFNVVGIACGPHKSFRHCVVIDYGRNNFLPPTYTAPPKQLKPPVPRIMRKAQPGQALSKPLPAIQKPAYTVKSQSKPPLPAVSLKKSETTNYIKTTKEVGIEATARASNSNDCSRSQSVNRTSVKSQRSFLVKVQERANTKYAKSPYAAQQSPNHVASVSYI